MENDEMEVEKPARRVAAVENSTTKQKLGGKKSGKLTVADLDDREKEVMKTYIERGILTQEAYLESIAKAKGLI